MVARKPQQPHPSPAPAYDHAQVPKQDITVDWSRATRELLPAKSPQSTILYVGAPSVTPKFVSRIQPRQCRSGRAPCP